MPPNGSARNWHDARKFGIQGIDPDRHAQHAVAYLLENDLSTHFDHAKPLHVFNCFDDSGYLIFKLYPRYSLFIDGRVDPIVPSGDHLEKYLRMCADPDYFDAMAQKYDIHIVLLRTNSIYQSSMWNEIFDRNPYWQVVFYDPDENTMILLRRKF